MYIIVNRFKDTLNHDLMTLKSPRHNTQAISHLNSLAKMFYTENTLNLIDNIIFYDSNKNLSSSSYIKYR